MASAVAAPSRVLLQLALTPWALLGLAKAVTNQDSRAAPAPVRVNKLRAAAFRPLGPGALLRVAVAAALTFAGEEDATMGARGAAKGSRGRRVLVARRAG